jgi:hypothetical protein
MKLSSLALSFVAAALCSTARAQWSAAAPPQQKGGALPPQKIVTPKPRAPGQGGAHAAAQGGSALLVLPPPNDDCTGAGPISGLGTFGLDTTGATGTGISGTCQPAENDVWFAWTATSSGAVEVRTCSLVASDTVIAVWADCPATTLIACNDDACSVQSRVQFAVTAGTTYFLEFGEYNSGVTYVGAFDISALGAPPANDDCSGATPIGGLGTFGLDTTGALGTVASGTCAQANNDVWFAWTSTLTGPVVVDCCGLATDTVIAVWADCPATTLIDCNDDFCGFQSQVQFAATNGVTYYFEFGAYAPATSYVGSFNVGTPPPPPADDDCSTPTVLVGPGPYAFDSTLATTGAQGQTEALCNVFGTTAIEADEWFCWTAPSTNAFELSTVGLTFVDTKVAVYDGCGCPSAGALACNDDSCGTLQSTLAFNAIGGQTYTIQIGSFQGTPGGTGSFAIDLANGPVGGCTLDDGVSENAVGLTNGGKTVWMARFGQIGVTTTVGDVLTAYGTAAFPGAVPPNGTPTDVLVWDDPNDDGDPSDCVLVYQGASTVQNASTDTLNSNPVVPAVGVSGYFFVGVGVAHAANELPAPLDQSSADCSGLDPTWIFGDTTGTVDYAVLTNNNVPPIAASSAGFPGFWLLRGSCSTEPGTGYCTGDGLDPSLTQSCPCSNFGAAGNGCASSFNAAGAHIGAHGVVASDNVALDGSGMNATGSCIFLKGNASTPTGIVFGDGVRCADGVLIRLRAVALVSGTASFPNSTETITLSVRGGTPVGSGAVGYYTVYYRNAAAAFCPPATFNAANGYQITW